VTADIFVEQNLKNQENVVVSEYVPYVTMYSILTSTW